MAKAALKIQLSPTEERLLSVYGTTMSLDEIAKELKLKVTSIYTMRATGDFPITLFRPTGRKLIGYTSAVAAHLDSRHAVQMRDDAALFDSIHN